MLIGDFASRLSTFTSSGSFGVEELDDYFKSLDVQLARSGFDLPGRMFHLAVSFLLNQVTEQDVFATPYKPENSLNATFAHGRRVLTPPQMIILRRPPIRHRAIELIHNVQAAADPSMIRAPGICFLAYENVALFHEHAPALHRNCLDGQAYGFLVRFDLGDADEWLAALQKMFEPFHIYFWLDALGANARSNVVTLVTTKLAPYEI